MSMQAHQICTNQLFEFTIQPSSVKYVLIDFVKSVLTTVDAFTGNMAYNVKR